jgi:hypothetical protein
MYPLAQTFSYRGLSLDWARLNHGKPSEPRTPARSAESAKRTASGELQAWRRGQCGVVLFAPAPEFYRVNSPQKMDGPAVHQSIPKLAPPVTGALSGNLRSSFFALASFFMRLLGFLAGMIFSPL